MLSKKQEESQDIKLCIDIGYFTFDFLKIDSKNSIERKLIEEKKNKIKKNLLDF